MTVNTELKIVCSSAQKSVNLNPDVWSSYRAIAQVLPHPPNSISRDDLRSLALSAFNENDALLSELFVKTMMWGSGTTNGRGPRNTNKALTEGHPRDVLIEMHRYLQSSDIDHAYYLYRRLPGVGPSFHTKLLWVVGSTITELKSKPLILDELVWLGLKEIKWNSVRSAGTVRRGARYIAYINECKKRSGENNCDPEDVEYSLYQLGKEINGVS